MISDPMVGVFDASSRARSLRRNSTKRSFAVFAYCILTFLTLFDLRNPKKYLTMHSILVNVTLHPALHHLFTDTKE